MSEMMELGTGYVMLWIIRAKQSEKIDYQFAATRNDNTVNEVKVFRTNKAEFCPVAGRQQSM